MTHNLLEEGGAQALHPNAERMLVGESSAKLHHL